jgi:ABC-type dipeptide/oligopeptide/nickel transport system permease component
MSDSSAFPAPAAPARWAVLVARARDMLPLLWRLLWRIPMLLFLTAAVFFVLRVLPVDPIGMLLPPNATEVEVQALIEAFGLDRPIPVQFGIWLRSALHGDLGRTMHSGLDVVDLILKALPVTLQLIACGLLLGVAFGVGGGLLAFRFRGTRIERVVQIATSISISVPEFLWAILLILGVGIGLQWLPFLGQLDAGMIVTPVTGFLLADALIAGDFAAWWSAVQHLALPSIALSLGIAPPLMRILHSSLLDAYAEDYVAAARLRGQSENRILVHHALKNAALPTVSMLGVQTSMVVGGTLLIETIFGFPGIGSLMVNAIGGSDLPMIQGLALTYAIAVQAINMITDVALLLLNPRLRLS